MTVACCWTRAAFPLSFPEREHIVSRLSGQCHPIIIKVVWVILADCFYLLTFFDSLIDDITMRVSCDKSVSQLACLPKEGNTKHMTTSSSLVLMINCNPFKVSCISTSKILIQSPGSQIIHLKRASLCIADYLAII